MDLRIKNRKELEDIASYPFHEKTAVISIADFNCDFPELKHKPQYLLQLAFDDADNYIFENNLERIPLEPDQFHTETDCHMITDDIAKQIVDFFLNIYEKTDVLICQSEHGKSRSAAIAAALLEYKAKGGIYIFSHIKYSPNKLVFKKVLQKLKMYEYYQTLDD